MQQQKQLRVSSGTAKNKKLTTPEIEGFRPVQEIAKQAIFSIIGDKITNANCLDLFAGSGNMGIEALSRGAGWCDFVDSSHEAKEAIEKNLFDCGFSDKAEVFFQPAVKYVSYASQDTKKYDVIFADPFYEDTAQTHLLKLIPAILAQDGLAILLYGKQLKLETVLNETGLNVVTTRKFGASHFSILQHLPKSQKTA